MGNDTKAWLRSVAKHGFEGYDKKDFFILHGQRKHKVYWKKIFIGSVALTPGSSRSLENVVHDLKRSLAKAEASLKEKATK